MRFGMYINFTFLVLSRKVVQSHSRYFRFYLGCHQLSGPPNLVEISFGFRSFTNLTFIHYSDIQIHWECQLQYYFWNWSLKLTEILLWPWEFENLNWRVPIDENHWRKSLMNIGINIIEVIINPNRDLKVHAS